MHPFKLVLHQKQGDPYDRSRINHAECQQSSCPESEDIGKPTIEQQQAEIRRVNAPAFRLPAARGVKWNAVDNKEDEGGMIRIEIIGFLDIL